MKHLKKFNEEIVNISKKTKFPAYGDSPEFKDRFDRKDRSKFQKKTDKYIVYKLNKNELGRYLNTWFKGDRMDSEDGDIVYLDELWTVKKVDKDTAHDLYGREFNPVSLNIHPTGPKISKNDSGENLYDLKAQIHSIDDSSFGMWFKQKSLQELEDIRNEIMRWLNQFTVKNPLNGDNFIEFGQGIGAVDIDYN